MRNISLALIGITILIGFIGFKVLDINSKLDRLLKKSKNPDDPNNIHHA